LKPIYNSLIAFGTDNAKEFNLPFHIASLRSSKCKDAVLRQDIQTQWIDSFLVDDYKVFSFLFRIDSLITDQIFKIDNFLNLDINKSPLRLDKLFTLLCR